MSDPREIAERLSKNLNDAQRRTILGLSDGWQRARQRPMNFAHSCADYLVHNTGLVEKTGCNPRLYRLTPLGQQVRAILETPR